MRWNALEHVVVPSTPKARVKANLDAITVLNRVEAENRYATAEEQDVIAGFSSWGAVPQVFDPTNDEWATERARAQELLTDEEYHHAASATLSAHYTDPAVVAGMWNALNEAGLTEGLVLEPGSGSGNFIGQAPEGTHMLGVELDPTSARVSAALYPDATIHAYGFEKFTMPEGVISAAVGNVPYGGFKLHDARYNAAGSLSIHNHFIAKSLRLTAPGGMVAVITSSYTMDAKSSRAREELARYGDLVSAVRLPNEAFKKVAGTEVLADVLVFRRRGEKEKPNAETLKTWTQASTFDVDGQSITLNDYFQGHPENILGSISTHTNQYGEQRLSVSGVDGTELGHALAERMSADLSQATKDGLGYAPAPVPVPDQVAARLMSPGLMTAPAALDGVVGQVRADEATGEIMALSADGLWEPVPLKGSAKVRRETTQETTALVGIKEAARAVVEAQKPGTHTPEERAELREQLRERYDAYVGQYGPINRFEEKVGRRPTAKAIERAMEKAEREWRASLDPDLDAAERREMIPDAALVAEWREDATQREVVRVQAHTIPLRSDPDFGLLMAVEDFDEDTKTARGSRLMHTDVLAGSTMEAKTASTAQEALAISLDESRQVDVARIAELLGVTEEDAATQLVGLVYTDPATGELLPATRYLSGDVGSKLAVASQAVVDGRSEFVTNVEALAQALPRRIEHYEIATKPGNSWLTVEDHQAFCEEVLKTSSRLNRDETTGAWLFEDTQKLSKVPAAQQLKYGVGKSRSALWVMEQVMNNRSLRVMVKDPDSEDGKKRIEDPKLTTLARAKARELTDAFSTWLYSDQTRRERVVTEYNRVFNSFVAPDYTAQGEALALPGLTADIQPHPYQREAVARIVSEPTVLLDHVVGAGKTGTMTMAAMELRRLGVARKPWIVVPNHLVDQVGREFTQWYPSARVLAVPSALDLQGRKQYVAASAAGDWDAVVVPYSVFEKISVAPERASAWLSEEIEEARAAIEDAEETGQKFTVKQAEQRVKRLETAMATYQSGKDIGLTFEESGCDYLFVDEAHSFKNLSRVSDFSELSHTGSNRAQDLDFKLRALRETKTEQAEAAGLDVDTYQPAVATFATGTPVANSLAEMWVMQHYLRPDLLERAGMQNVNSWGNAFTQFAQRMEVDPSGSKYRSVARLSKFQNLPELLGMSQQFTSTVGTEDLTAALPELAGGERTALVREASPAVAAFVQQLGERAEAVQAGMDPAIDNMLKITNDGRAAALDPRLMGLPADADGGRVRQVTDEVMRIWEESKDTVYKNGLGEDHPVPGGLQLLFCDRAIPNDEGKFSIYDEIKVDLISRGMPESMIAFIHDAKDDADKADLFERCRTGAVQVLIGSTERMGTGTNVQARAVALHHVDIPWRPADLEQREGRILRQGNQNQSVQICNYITAGTFDAYMWQTVARKAEFISQVKHAKVTERVVEDISSSSALAFAELSALATGNPDAIRYAEVMGEIAELEVVRKGHFDSLAQVRAETAFVKETITTIQAGIEDLGPVVSKVPDTDAKSVITPAGTRAGLNTVEAGTALRTALGQEYVAGSKGMRDHYRPLARVNGIDVVMKGTRHGVDITVSGPNGPVQAASQHWGPSKWESSHDGRGIGMSLRNLVNGLAGTQETLQQRLVASQTELAGLEATDTRAGFPRESELDALHTEEQRLREALGFPDPNDAADDEIEDVDEPDRVLSDDFPGLMDRDALISATNLPRVGDIIQDPKRSTVQYLVTQVDGTTYSLADPTTGEHQRDAMTMEVDGFGLVARERAALTEAEALLLELPATHEATVDGKSCTVGDTVTVRDGAKSFHGTVTDVSDSWNAIVTVQDAVGETHEIRSSGSTRGPVFIRHDVHTLEEVEAQAQVKAEAEAYEQAKVTYKRLLPGDVLLEDLDGLGNAGDVRRRDGMADPATGEMGERERGANGIIQVQPGRELTEEEITVLNMEAQIAKCVVTALRQGDRVMEADLVPKASLNRELVITSEPHPYGRAEIGYSVVGKPWETHTVTRGENSTVSLLGRRYGALTDAELLRLANPEHTFTEIPTYQVADSAEDMQGRWARLTDVRLHGQSGPKAVEGVIESVQKRSHANEIHVRTHNGLVTAETWHTSEVIVSDDAATPRLRDLVGMTIESSQQEDTDTELNEPEIVVEPAPDLEPETVQAEAAAEEPPHESAEGPVTLRYLGRQVELDEAGRAVLDRNLAILSTETGGEGASELRERITGASDAVDLSGEELRLIGAATVTEVPDNPAEAAQLEALENFAVGLASANAAGDREVRLSASTYTDFAPTLTSDGRAELQGLLEVNIDRVETGEPLSWQDTLSVGAWRSLRDQLLSGRDVPVSVPLATGLKTLADVVPENERSEELADVFELGNRVLDAVADSTPVAPRPMPVSQETEPSQPTAGVDDASGSTADTDVDSTDEAETGQDTATDDEPAEESSADAATQDREGNESAEALARVHVDHSSTGTTVTMSSADTEARAVVKRAGLRWSRTNQFWYMPRNWKPETKMRRLSQMVRDFVSDGVEFSRATNEDTVNLERGILLAGDVIGADQLDLRAGAHWTRELAPGQTRLPVTLVAAEDGTLSGRVDGPDGRHWDVDVYGIRTHMTTLKGAHATGPVHLLTEEEIAERIETAEASDVEALDQLAGVSTDQVEPGDTVHVPDPTKASDLPARGLNDAIVGTVVIEHASLSITRAGVQADHVEREVLHVTEPQRDGDRPALVLSPDEGQEEPTVIVPEGDTVDVTGASDEPALVADLDREDMPTVGERSLNEVEPGQSVSVTGTETDDLDAEQETTVTGRFVALTDNPTQSDTTDVVVEDQAGELQRVAVPTNQVHLRSATAIVLPWEKPQAEREEWMQPAEMDPLPEAAFTGPDANNPDHWNTVGGRDLKQASVLRHENSPKRLALLDMRTRNGQSQAAVLDLADLAAGVQVVTIDAAARYQVEPYPANLGQMRTMNARDLTVSMRDFQVAWDQPSMDAGWQLRNVGPGADNDRVNLTVANASGEQKRFSMPAGQELVVRSWKTPPVNDVVVQEPQSVAASDVEQQAGAPLHSRYTTPGAEIGR